MPSPDELIATLTQRLIDLVEPNTRFDRGSLPVLRHAAMRVDVRGSQRYQVSFGVGKASGKGRLGSAVLRCADAHGLEQHLDAHEAQNRQRLGARLEAWSSSQKVLPGAKLTDGQCYDGPGVAGYDHACGTCGGAGRLQCISCSGSGEIICSYCHGSGDVTCGTCKGQRLMPCSSCGGRGQHSAQRAQRRVNSADNREWTEHETVWVDCAGCGGRGKQPCGCGNGREYCGNCRRGKITCSTCAGGGQTNCATCDATGFLNATAWLTCTVRQDFALRAATDIPEAKNTLEAIPSLDAWCALTAVEITGTQIGPSDVRREFGAAPWLTRIRVLANHTEIELFGYGDAAIVYDFKNVVGTLLARDLASIEAALETSAKLPFRTAPRLDAAIAEFLRSEVNAAIGIVAGAKRERLEGFARDDLQGAVSSDYVLRAARAVRLAAVRTYAGIVALPILALGLLVGIVLEVFTLWSIFLFDRDEARIVALCSFLAGALAIEWRARWLLRRRFTPGLATKIIKLLAATGAPGWALGAAVAWAALATWALGAFLAGANRLPPGI
jgi:hypothetical protein